MLKLDRVSLFLSLALVPGNNVEYQLMFFSLQSPLNRPAMKMSIQTPVECRPAVGIWLTPTGLQSAPFQEECCKNDTSAIPHWATLEHNCVHWPEKAGLLSSTQPSHQPCTILCLSCSSWLLESSTVDPALVLPYCDNSSHSQFCANKYLFGFVAMFSATASPWPCFSLPRICGSLQGSPALVSCRNKHAHSGQLIAA